MNDIKVIAPVKKTKLKLSAAILLLLIGGTLFLLFKNENLSQILLTIKNINLNYVVLGLMAVFLFICCEAVNSQNIFSTLGKKVSFFQTLKYAFIGFYFCAITPTASGGQPMQAYYMKKDGINISHSSLALLINVAVFQLVTIGYVLLALSANYTLVIEHVKSLRVLFFLGIAGNIMVLCFILGSIFFQELTIKILSTVLGFLSKVKIIKNKNKYQAKVIQSVNEYSQSAHYILHKPNLIVKLFITTFIQITAMYSVPFFVYKAFGFSSYSLVNMISLQTILTISASSTPLPGAVGIAEGGFMLLFKTFFPGRVLKPAMLISRGISFYAFLIISGIVTLKAHILSKNTRIITK